MYRVNVATDDLSSTACADDSLVWRNQTADRKLWSAEPPKKENEKKTDKAG
jgi:hypothetical protein